MFFSHLPLMRSDPFSHERQTVGRLSTQVKQGSWQDNTHTPFALASYLSAQSAHFPSLHEEHPKGQASHLPFTNSRPGAQRVQTLLSSISHSEQVDKHFPQVPSVNKTKPLRHLEHVVSLKQLKHALVHLTQSVPLKTLPGLHLVQLEAFP